MEEANKRIGIANMNVDKDIIEKTALNAFQIAHTGLAGVSVNDAVHVIPHSHWDGRGVILYGKTEAEYK